MKAKSENEIPVFAQWYKESPLGPIYLTSDGEALTGLWFETHQKYWEAKEDDILVEAGSASDLPLFQQTVMWLNTYFDGKDPGPIPPVNLYRVTPFRREVCEEMIKIPYGKITTYGTIAETMAKRRGIPKMSSRAVGGGVGHNPISIIIPCHRVIGASKSLTGYGGGIQRKIKLLELEGHVIKEEFSVPTKGTAL